MKNKPVQLFSDEYLESCKRMTPTQIAKFLEDFRKTSSPYSSESKLISIKIPENLLEIFKLRSNQNGVKYQSKIKELMREWIISLE